MDRGRLEERASSILSLSTNYVRSEDMDSGTSEKPKILIVIRHGDRLGPQGLDSDTGLTEKGKEQARRIQRFFSASFPMESPELISSPRLRCRETLQALAISKGLPIEISLLLEEGGDLRTKVDRFIKKWKHAPARIMVACSHGDWIPVLLDQLVSKSIDLSTGSWVEVELRGGACELKRIMHNIELASPNGP